MLPEEWEAVKAVVEAFAYHHYVLLGDISKLKPGKAGRVPAGTIEKALEIMGGKATAA